MEGRNRRFRSFGICTLRAHRLAARLDAGSTASLIPSLSHALAAQASSLAFARKTTRAANRG